jgi:type II secretory pathway component PulF
MGIIRKKQVLTAKEEIQFLTRLWFLSRAQTSFVQSLGMVQDQFPKQKQEIFSKFIADIKNGKSFTESLENHSLISRFSISMIGAAEISGKRQEILAYTSQELAKNRELKKKLIGAFIYPLFIAVATLFLSVFLMIYIFPKILPLITSTRAAVPLTTRILIFIYENLQRYGIVSGLGIFGITFLVLFLLRKYKSLRIRKDVFILRIPYIGTLLRNYILAGFCRITALLLKAGMPMSEVISSMSTTMTNEAYRDALKKSHQAFLQGKSLEDVLKTSPILFPRMLTQLIQIGEKSGTLSETLTYLSESYESDLETQTKNLPNILEPVLMLSMGLVVGFIAISIITPIYEITQNIQR